MSSSSKLISHPHQPLWQHLKAVDDISAAALNFKFVNPALASKEDMDNWRKLLVYFHDFGKSTKYFQHRIIEAALKENPELENLDNTYINAFINQFSPNSIKEELDFESKLGSHAELGAFVAQHSFPTDHLLLRAIILEIIKRHHGDLKNFCQDEFDLDEDKIERIKKQWEHSNKADYTYIIESFGFGLPDDIASVLRQFGGTRFFMQLNKLLPADNLKPYLLTLFLFSLLLAADKGDLMLDGQSRNQVGEHRLFRKDTVSHYKSHTFGGQEIKSIDLLREKAFQMVERYVLSHPDAPFYSITLPTGLGKTLTAFNAAFILQNQIALRKGYTPRIIYCLPFTSVIDQNATILEEILNIAGDNDGYLARHHYLADWPEQKGENNELSDSEKEYFTEGWEYPFTVTTFVQLLETLFSNRNRKLRKFHNLANAIIILDEVQNIEAKYFETVEAMFQAMHDYFDTRFVFVTATQPFLIKEKEVIELTDPSKEQTRRFFTGMNRIQLDVSLWKKGRLPLEELLPHFQGILEANREKSFLFILNKVRASQNVFHQLRKDNPDAEMVYLSAAVLPILRKQRIEKIKAHGRNGVKKQLIVVSTQVVEAGVDIDLDIVYRDFAPLDSINQSAGRCNRNGLKGKGEVRLFEMDKGWNKIYDDVLIHATRRVIEQAVSRLRSDIIPEKEFYYLNETYAQQIREKVADNSAHSELIGYMKKLQFETVNEKFKVIEKDRVTYSVFIDCDNNSASLWRRYQEVNDTVKDRWDRKKELRKLRPELLQYVVQFPDYMLPAEFKDRNKAIIYLGTAQYPSCYDLETGYKKEDETSIHVAQQC